MEAILSNVVNEWMVCPLVAFAGVESIENGFKFKNSQECTVKDITGIERLNQASFSSTASRNRGKD